MPPIGTDADTTGRSVTINVDGQEVKACTGLGMTVVKINNMDDKLDLLIEKVDALNHAKRDGATTGGIMGGIASGVALFSAWLWTRISGGG